MWTYPCSGAGNLLPSRMSLKSTLTGLTRLAPWGTCYCCVTQKDTGCEDILKECHSILRDEASVYFNVTAVHVGHLVARVYNPLCQA